MKKWVIYLLITSVVPILSYGGFGGEDVGKFDPVQVVMISANKDSVQLLTDGGQLGMGKSLPAAMENLNNTSTARVFLDTAEYLLIEPGMEALLPQLQKNLRPSCSLCYSSGTIDLADAARYLQLHEPKLTLTQYEAGERKLPTLINYEGRMELVRP